MDSFSWVVAVITAFFVAASIQTPSSISRPAELAYTIKPRNVKTITNLLSSGDGSTIALYDLTRLDQGVEIWRIEEPKLVMTIPMSESNETIFSMLLSDTGRYVAIASETLDVWDLYEQERVASFSDYDDYAFFVDDDTFIYTTMPPIETESQTVIYNLVSTEEIAAFEFPVTGRISIAPDGSSVIVGDILNATLFNLMLNKDGIWTFDDLTAELGSFELRDIEHYDSRFVVLELEAWRDDGTYVRMIDLDASKNRAATTNYFPSNRIFLSGQLAIIYDRIDNFELFEPFKREILEARPASWYLSGYMSDGSRYALLDPDGNIDIYLTGNPDPHTRIIDCLCNLSLTTDETMIVAWNSRGIFVYQVP